MERPTLRGERLILRAPGETDLDALTETLADPEVAAAWPGYDRVRVQEELIAEADDVVVFAIEHEGRVIGAIQYGEEDDPQYRHASVDVFVGSRWHGRGLGTESIRLVVRHLFSTLGHHRVVIDPAAHNTRAIRAYERVGFRTVGTLRRYERGPDGAWHDGLLMDLLDGELR